MKGRPAPSLASDSLADRQKRQAEALRANLARRKNQTRARLEAGDVSSTNEQQGTVDHGDHA